MVLAPASWGSKITVASETAMIKLPPFVMLCTILVNLAGFNVGILSKVMEFGRLFLGAPNSTW